VKRKSAERQRFEKELLFALELYNELKGREGVAETLYFLDLEIDKLVEQLKQM
jgi:hypothetical protein